MSATNGHKVIKVEDITSRIIKLRQDIDKEKNPIEKKRLQQAQASLIYTRNEMAHYTGLIENPNRRIRAH